MRVLKRQPKITKLHGSVFIAGAKPFWFRAIRSCISNNIKIGKLFGNIKALGSLNDDPNKWKPIMINILCTKLDSAILRVWEVQKRHWIFLYYKLSKIINNCECINAYGISLLQWLVLWIINYIIRMIGLTIIFNCTYIYKHLLKY